MNSTEKSHDDQELKSQADGKKLSIRRKAVQKGLSANTNLQQNETSYIGSVRLQIKKDLPKIPFPSLLELQNLEEYPP